MFDDAAVASCASHSRKSKNDQNMEVLDENREFCYTELAIILRTKDRPRTEQGRYIYIQNKQHKQTEQAHNIN